MQISPGVWPAHGTKINLKISQRMFGVAERWGRGSTRPWTSSQGKGRAPACQRHIWSAKREKKRSRFEAGMLEREKERVSKEQPGREHVSSCVCVLAAERGTTKLCTHQAKPRSCQRSWEMCPGSRAVSQSLLWIWQGLRKKLQLATFSFITSHSGIFYVLNKVPLSPLIFNTFRRGFWIPRESKHLIFSSLSTLNIRQHASSEDDTCTWHKNIQFKFREKRRI